MSRTVTRPEDRIDSAKATCKDSARQPKGLTMPVLEEHYQKDKIVFRTEMLAP